ncbi:uncharacterized protein LOC131854191, partial [Achroia grisella]|uniref:uncharacterized protein LOC131854191 n=1 Tax=Achroia grisella TaxID=688607 RepID=UPI0027D217AD
MVLSQHKHVTEVLLSNKLDKDFQSMLLPLELANNFILLPKYYIRDDFITPKGTISNFISFFSTFIIVIVYIINYLYGIEFGYDFNIYFTFDFIACVSGFIINLIINIYQTSNSVHLNVKLQNIFNILDTNKTVLKKITLLNWVYMLSLSIFYLI